MYMGNKALLLHPLRLKSGKWSATKIFGVLSIPSEVVGLLVGHSPLLGFETPPTPPPPSIASFGFRGYSLPPPPPSLTSGS